MIYAHHRLTVFSAFWLFIISGIRLWGGDASSRCSRSRLWRSRSSCFLASPAHSVCTCSNSDTNLWKPTHIITHHHTSSHTIKRHHHTASYIVKQPHTSTHPPQWSDALRTHGRSFHLYRAELYNSWEWDEGTVQPSTSVWCWKLNYRWPSLSKATRASKW